MVEESERLSPEESENFELDRCPPCSGLCRVVLLFRSLLVRKRLKVEGKMKGKR